MSKDRRPERKWEDIHWDLKRPCDDCPFAKRSPWHQGIAEGTLSKVLSLGEFIQFQADGTEAVLRRARNRRRGRKAVAR